MNDIIYTYLGDYFLSNNITNENVILWRNQCRLELGWYWDTSIQDRLYILRKGTILLDVDFDFSKRHFKITNRSMYYSLYYGCSREEAILLRLKL